MTTIIDAIDGFFGAQPDVQRVPGRRLLEFGEEVRRLEGTVDPEPERSGIPVSYLGGWPSANVWLSQNAPLVMSSLLYSQGAIACDPVTDWFSHYRYRRPQVLGSRPGYLDDKGEPDVGKTRSFLSVAMPALDRLRPLIESGAVRLVPSQRLQWEKAGEVETVARRVIESIDLAPAEFARRFRPSDLARADSLRGLFVFAGGDRENQIRQAVEQAVRYFAGEYVLASLFSGTYVAPYPFEQFLCSNGLGASVRREPGGRVLQALMHTSLPVFQGLTPSVLASIRDDDAFGSFRSELYSAYAALPESGTQEDLTRMMREAEDAVLAPRVAQARRAANSGPYARVLRVLDVPFRIALSIAVAATSPLGLASQAAAAASSSTASTLLDRAIRKPEGTTAIWTSLLRHNQGVDQHVEQSTATPGEVQPSKPYWGIPEQASMRVLVSEGLAIWDWMANPPDGSQLGSHERPYAPCPCGSGQKWKFCCK